MFDSYHNTTQMWVYFKGHAREIFTIRKGEKLESI